MASLRYHPFAMYIFRLLLFGGILLNTNLFAQQGSLGGLTAPPSTATAPTTTGSVESSIDQGGNPVSVTFSNQSGSTVNALWVDFQGSRQPVGAILPNQAMQLTTYPGHLTVFMSNNQQVAKFRATATNGGSAFAIVGRYGRAASPIPSNSLSVPQNLVNPTKPSGVTTLADIGNLIRSLNTPVQVNQPSNFSGNSAQGNRIPSGLTGGTSNLASLLNQFSNPSSGNRTNASNAGNNRGNKGGGKGNRGSANASGSQSVIEAAIFNATNQIRQQQGLPQFRSAPPADSLSRGHSNSMLNQRTLSHSGAQGRAQSSTASMGIAYKGYGENVAYDYDAGSPGATADKIVKGWMNSPPHRKNILNRQATYLGVGTASGPNGVVYATQLFLF